MKTNKKSQLGIAVLTAVVALSLQPAFAKDNFFGKVNMQNTDVSNPPQMLPIDEVRPPMDGQPTAGIDFPAVSSQKLQDATLSIESAQVELRKQLSVVQQKFSEVDKNYQLVKLERKDLKHQIKQTKSSLNSLENTKKRIKKEMASPEIKSAN